MDILGSFATLSHDATLKSVKTTAGSLSPKFEASKLSGASPQGL